MRSVRDIEIFENIPVLVRASLNVPVEDAKVMNDYRLRRALPTLRYLQERGARVILVSHLGQKGTETLAPVADALGSLMRGVAFSPETTGKAVRAQIHDLMPGQILVLENVRRDRREEANDPEFAKELAALADVFVQDNFDTCHRRHASIVSVPKLLPSYAGFLVEEEVHELSSALSPKSPSLAIIGGAKFSTKEAVLTALLKKYDTVFVGGALANDFLKASGREIGKSLVSAASEKSVKHLLANPKLKIPLDLVVVPASSVGALNAREETRTAPVESVGENEFILDHGPATVRMLTEHVREAKTILWNGPLGNYESGFIEATNGLARAIAESKAHSVIGGGDTVAAIENLGLLSRFSFVSTGGGAMLEYLAHGTLPGLEALK